MSIVKFEGRVARVLFKSAEGNYKVLKVRPAGKRKEKIQDDKDSLLNEKDGESSEDVVETLLPPEVVSRDGFVTVVGNLDSAREGMRIEVSGTVVRNARFGAQIQVSSYTVLGTTRNGLISFMMEEFPKVGVIKAGQIFDRYGEESLDRIREDPGALVDFVGAETSAVIHKNVVSSWDRMRVTAKLAEAGITPKAASRVYDAYGKESEALLQDNPYAFCVVERISFTMIDGLFQDKFSRDFIGRIQFGLIHVLDESGQEGHTYLSAGDLVDKAVSLLKCDAQTVLNVLLQNIVRTDNPEFPELAAFGVVQSGFRGRMVLEPLQDPDVEGGYAHPSYWRVFTPKNYVAERGVAFHIKRLLLHGEGQRRRKQEEIDRQVQEAVEDRLLNGGDGDLGDPVAEVLEAHQGPSFDVEAVEKAIGFTDEGRHLDPVQIQAVEAAVRSKVLILTGGPGTGKTTVTKAILATAGKGRVVSLCAPTGRAAKRLTEVTGKVAKTIHRTLQWTGDPLLPGSDFEYNAAHYLPCSMVIVDEVSMLDIHIAYALLSAIPDDAKLVLVGDRYQLPSVGEGKVLADLLSIPDIPSVELQTVHRQKDGGVVDNAHRIHRGESIQPDGGEVQFFPTGPVEVVPGAVADLYGPLVEEFNEVQVMSPTKKGMVGVDELNRTLQMVRNPPSPLKPEILHTGRIFRQSDRVMHTKNNRQLGVYNGDIGHIEEIRLQMIEFTDEATGETKSKLKTSSVEVDVLYGTDLVTYRWGDLEELTHAYACTVHKCVHPSTLVESEYGLLPIRVLHGKTSGQVASPHGPRVFSDFVTTGVRPMRQIQTKDGYRLMVTPEHGVDTWDGEMFARKEVADIRKGDLVRLKLGVTVDPHELPRLPQQTYVPRERSYRVPAVMGPLVAEFLGLMVADGTLHDRGFRIAKCHEDVVERFTTMVHSLFGIIPRRYQERGAYFAEVNSTSLARWLREVGGMDPNRKEVPECVLRSPHEIHRSFLRGLFEDGGVNMRDGVVDHIEWSTVYPELENVVRTMLLREGIISGTTRNRRCHTVYLYGLEAEKFRSVGFVSKAKRGRLEHAGRKRSRYMVPIGKGELEGLRPFLGKYDFANCRARGQVSRTVLEKAVEVGYQTDKLDFHYTEVTEVEDAGSEEAVCLTVPEGHQFLQNGFCGWNSQGCEFPAVIVVMHSCVYKGLRQRTLLYTAFTRGKKRVVCVGQMEAFDSAVQNTQSQERMTTLRGRFAVAPVQGDGSEAYRKYVMWRSKASDEVAAALQERQNRKGGSW